MDEQELDERFQEMEQDTHVKTAEAAATQAPQKKKRITVAELNKAIDDIQDVKFPETLDWIGELDTRIEKIERGSSSNRTDVAADIAARLNNQDAAINALVDALRTHIETVETPTRSPDPEIEFAQPPAQTAGGTIDISGIAAVANVCRNMTDVLTITRALKEVPELTDEERNEILTIACRYSGVILAPGLQIRAGMKFTGA